MGKPFLSLFSLAIYSWSLDITTEHLLVYYENCCRLDSSLTELE